MDNPIQRAITIMGGLKATQERLGLKSYQSIQQWRRVRVPAGYCPDIEAATGGAVRCEDLRPDINWAVLRNSDCPEQEVA
jgi:DNA-binding transcriptional regulator YdaS (Cro superfamily)